MIYFGTSPRDWATLDDGNTIHTSARGDDLVIVRASDPAVLEARVNEVGRAQANAPNARGLAGVQLGGSGQGGQYAVLMLFTKDTAPAEVGDLQLFTTDDAAAGIEAFFFKAETEEELTVQMDEAIARADAFGGSSSTTEWKGFEVAGSSFGGEHMGMLIAYRSTPS
jgi:hypothetical protein